MPTHRLYSVNLAVTTTFTGVPAVYVLSILGTVHTICVDVADFITQTAFYASPTKTVWVLF